MLKEAIAWAGPELQSQIAVLLEQALVETSELATPQRLFKTARG
jgi:hypothetical protein